MISKNSRRTTGSVEQLKQGSFTAVKGIDETAPALNTETVLRLKNLDVAIDGGLTLRKPILCVNDIPEVYIDGVVAPTEVRFIKYLFDKTYRFVIRESTTGTQYVGIFKENSPVTVRLGWTSWQDYTQYYTKLTATSNGYFELPYVDLKNIRTSNTSTSTVCTNVFVDILSEVFKRPFAEYPDTNSTDLCYSKLYDIPSTSSKVLFKPRTLIISKSTDAGIDFDISIVTPDINVMQTTEDIVLDVNLDLDNPYSIRDTYNTSAPTVKNILAYVPTYTKDGRTEIASENISQFTEPATGVKSFRNTNSVPQTFNPNLFDRNVLKAVPKHISDGIDTPYGTMYWHILLPTPSEYEDYSSKYLCRNICKDIIVDLSFNMWLEVGYDYETHYICIRIGNMAASGGISGNIESMDILSSYFYNSDLQYIREITVNCKRYIDTDVSDASSTVISHFTKLDGRRIGNMYMRFKSKGDDTVQVPGSVHGLENPDGGYATVSVLKDVPEYLSENELYTSVYCSLGFKYPVKKSTGYFWEHTVYYNL